MDILFGHDKDLDALQMSCRAVVIFVIALLLLRIAGIRTMGKKSAFDQVIIIMLGAILSRPVVGASAFLPTVASSLTFVLVHRILAVLGFHSQALGRMIKGERILLWSAGEEQKENMKKAQVTLEDKEETLRLSTGEETFEKVLRIFLERDGEISIIRNS